MKIDALAQAYAPRLLDWYASQGRHDLPWTRSRTPYHVWLSEVMLQQTQVATVIAYFERFTRALPDVRALAEASEDDVLALWTGLGYYSRARNLHKAARLCMDRHGGEIPGDFDALLALPGIGRSTAGAIMAQAFDAPYPILDGNVKRVFARLIGETRWPGEPTVEKSFWSLAQACLPTARLADYTQAQMDLGATLCTRSRPRCDACPLQDLCVAFARGQTDRIPAPRPKKIQPERAGHVVWLRNAEGAHYLEKRAAPGIWGGLWSLPQFVDRAAAEAWLRERGLVVAQTLPSFRHVFTHFKLTLTPLSVHTPDPLPLPDNGARWVMPDTLATLGLPAPIRTLLESAP